jgi:hypothetical protein
VRYKTTTSVLVNDDAKKALRVARSSNTNERLSIECKSIGRHKMVELLSMIVVMVEL